MENQRDIVRRTPFSFFVLCRCMKAELLFLLFVTFFVITQQNNHVSDDPEYLRKIPHPPKEAIEQPPTTTTTTNHSILIFRHMSKTGGTFLRLTLPAIIQGEPSPKTPTDEEAWKNESWYVNDRLIFISDRVAWPDDLRATTMKNTFVLLTMRHPCSWYRSFYHYRPSNPLKENRFVDFYQQRSLDEWVNALMFDKSFGYMSYRFWRTFVAPKNCYFFRYVDATSDEGPCSIERAKSELNLFSIQKSWLTVGC